LGGAITPYGSTCGAIYKPNALKANIKVLYLATYLSFRYNDLASYLM